MTLATPEMGRATCFPSFSELDALEDHDSKATGFSRTLDLQFFMTGMSHQTALCCEITQKTSETAPPPKNGTSACAPEMKIVQVGFGPNCS